MLVDGVWATVGSCNLHAYSLGGNAELNASVWDAEVTRSLRQTLFAKHLGIDSATMDDGVALQLLRETAAANASKLAKRQYDLRGLAFEIAARAYARESGPKPDLT